MATKTTLDSNVHGSSTSVGADGNISVDESPAASSPGRTDEDPEEGKIFP